MIDTAVLLAAGEGTRLRGVAPSKPLCPVAGKPLIARAIEGMAAAGLRRVIVVLGYEKDAVRAYLASRDWPIAVETVESRDHREPNGVSVLAARDAVGLRAATSARPRRGGSVPRAPAALPAGHLSVDR